MRKTAGYCLLVPLVLLGMGLSSCSPKEEPPEPARMSEKAANNQPAKASKEYGQRPVDKVRAAQRIGEERTQAIDEAAKRQ